MLVCRNQNPGVLMQEFIKVMKALSDPNRVKMLKLLQSGQMCVCELRAALGIAQPTASNHLKVLEDAGFVGSSKDGPWVNYYPADGKSSPYAALLLGAMKHWLENSPEIVAVMEKLPQIDRQIVCRQSRPINRNGNDSPAKLRRNNG